MKLVRLFGRKIRDETGVVTAEVVAVTAVTVALAMALAWVVFRDTLSDSAGIITTALLSFIQDSFP